MEVTVVPLIVGALETNLKRLEKILWKIKNPKKN